MKIEFLKSWLNIVSLRAGGVEYWVKVAKTLEVLATSCRPVSIPDELRQEIQEFVAQWIKDQAAIEGTAEWWAKVCPSLRQAEVSRYVEVEYYPHQKGIVLKVPSRAGGSGASQCVIRCADAEKVAVLAESFNSRQGASIRGKGVVWSYADGHGMKLGAVLRRGTTSVMWLPGHHSHGSGQEYDVLANEDGTVTVSPRATMGGALKI